MSSYIAERMKIFISKRFSFSSFCSLSPNMNTKSIHVHAFGKRFHHYIPEVLKGFFFKVSYLEDFYKHYSRQRKENKKCDNNENNTTTIVCYS